MTAHFSSFRHRAGSWFSRTVAALVLCSTLWTVTAASPAGALNESPQPDPIVFVHGFGGSIGGQELLFSAGMIPWLKAEGVPADRIFVFTYGADESIYDVMPRLKSFVEGALTQTGASKVDLVTHSKGGLVARGYVSLLDGAARVDAFAAVASTLSGGEIPFCGQLPIGRECLNNLPNSTLVQKLDAMDRTPGDTRYATWWSRCDGVIKPVTSATLDGAINHQQPCSTISNIFGNNHVTMPLNPRIWREVYDFISG